MSEDPQTQTAAGPGGAYREAAAPHPFIPFDKQTIEQLRAELAYWVERRDRTHIRILRQQLFDRGVRAL